MMHPYAQTAETVLAHLGTDRHTGISSDSLAARREAHGTNCLAQAPTITLWQRLASALREPMTLLLLFAALTLLTVNCIHGLTGGETDFAECLGVGIAIALSVGISVTMEGRSARAFEALRAMGNDVQPSVLRDGRRIRIPQEALVVGDLVFIGTGDKVMADGRLLESHELLVDESALTGESHPVRKSATATIAPSAPVAERRTMLYAGSFVTAGTGLMVVTAVGVRTEFGAIATALASQDQTQTPRPLG